MWDTGFHKSNKFNSFSVVPTFTLKFVPHVLEFTICRNNVSAVELRISVILNVIYASRTYAFCFAENNTTMALWCSVLDGGSLLIKKLGISQVQTVGSPFINLLHESAFDVQLH